MLKNIAIIIGNKVIRIYDDIDNEIKNFNLNKRGVIITYTQNIDQDYWLRDIKILVVDLMSSGFF